MKTKQFKITVILFAAVLMVFSACQKIKPDAQSAEDDARGSYIMADAFALSNTEAGNPGPGKTGYPENMTVERDSVKHTVKITFENCEYLGKLRNGVVNILYAENPTQCERAVNLTAVTFENYTFDGVGVEGTISSTFGGSCEKPEIKVRASNMVATFTDGKKIKWASDMVFTITEGFNDTDMTNDKFLISGTQSGINRDDKSFTSSYTEVGIDGACELGYPVSGTVDIKSNKSTTTINYGEGACDDAMTISANGIELTIHLD